MLPRCSLVTTRHLPLLAALGLALACGACSNDSEPLADGGPLDAQAAADAGAPADATAGLDAAAPADAASDAGALDSGQAGFQIGIEVEIDSGRVRGEAQDGLRIFKGIPYAEPPTGALRFRPPVATSPWTGTLQADEFGPSCPQTDFGPEFLLGGYGGPQSEDCLSLNVWGHDDEDQGRPVMVFIYGGGFIAGSSAWPLYDGQHLARDGDVVIVTLNYRVGTLGFLATESLVAEQGAAAAGNFGIQDQIEALRWVQRNIQAFGGDPNNVTVFGESAGAISVCALLGAPSADALFHKAIVQSGMCILGTARAEGLLGANSAIDAGEQTSADLGCRDEVDPNRCLRNLPVNDLIRATSLFSVLSADINALAGTSPYVDGVLIPEQPLERIARGDGDRPLMVGSNSREGVLFAGADTVLTRRGFERAVADFVGDESLASQIVDLYPLRDFPLVGDAWIAFLGDATFICHGVAAARAAASGAPAFAYHFTRAPLQLAAVGASHAIELPYLFNTFSEVVIVDGPADRRVSQAMRTAWTSFARTGQPDATPNWPAYTAASPDFLRLDDPVSTASEIRDGRCAALRSLGITP